MIADMQEVQNAEILSFHRAIPTVVPVQHLDEHDLRLERPFYVVVEEADGSYVATFYDAHISASGETQYEAIDNVKDMVSATFRRLDKTPPERLGPLPTKQIVTLRHFLSRKG